MILSLAWASKLVWPKIKDPTRMGSCVVPQGLGPRPNEPGTIPLTIIIVRGSNEKNISIKGKKVTKENDFK